jgi:hypothetical protein
MKTRLIIIPTNGGHQEPMLFNLVTFLGTKRNRFLKSDSVKDFTLKTKGLKILVSGVQFSLLAFSTDKTAAH